MYNNFCNKKQGSHLSVLSRFLPSGKEAAVASRPIPYSPGSYGGFFFLLHSTAAYLRFIQVTASLVYPLPIRGPTITLRHLPIATGGHVIALWRGHVRNG